jgi:hypothetical protein
MILTSDLLKLLFVTGLLILVGWSVFDAWRDYGGKLLSVSQIKFRSRIKKIVESAPPNKKMWTHRQWVEFWGILQKDLARRNSARVSAQQWRVLVDLFQTAQIKEGHADKRTCPRRAVQTNDMQHVKRVHDLAWENRFTVDEAYLEPIDFVVYRFNKLQIALADRRQLIQFFLAEDAQVEVAETLKLLDFVGYTKCKELLQTAYGDYRAFIDMVVSDNDQTDSEVTSGHPLDWKDTPAWDDLLVEPDRLAELMYRLNNYYDEEYPWAS